MVDEDGILPSLNSHLNYMGKLVLPISHHSIVHERKHEMHVKHVEALFLALSRMLRTSATGKLFG